MAESHGNPVAAAATSTKNARRGKLFAERCPSREVFRRVTSLWGVLVLIALRDGTLRFSELRRKAAGVSEKMLAQTLHGLEADGFVDRRSYPVVPPRVEYTLTPMGREVARQVAKLADWIETNLHRVVRARQNRDGNLGSSS